MSDVADFWNSRFGAEEYVYGTRPNDFLAEQARRLPPGGRVLCLGEGEGRNAVFLAGLGFDVTAVDAASEGVSKIRRLAAERGVSVAAHCVDLADYAIEAGAWDGIVSIFCHLPPDLRRRVHTAAAAGLRPGGTMLLEAYTPAQLAFGSGGPKDVELLYRAAELATDFAELELLRCAELEREVVEGRLHTGRAAVVQLVGVRPLAA